MQLRGNFRAVLKSSKNEAKVICSIFVRLFKRRTQRRPIRIRTVPGTRHDTGPMTRSRTTAELQSSRITTA